MRFIFFKVSLGASKNLNNICKMSSRILTLLLCDVVFILVGCDEGLLSSNSDTCEDFKQEVFEESTYRSISEAEEIAISEVSRILDDGDIKSRGFGKRTINSHLSKTIYSSTGSRGYSYPLMHVINFDDDEGYATDGKNIP